jgi:hypothetical protein
MPKQTRQRQCALTADDRAAHRYFAAVRRQIRGLANSLSEEPSAVAGALEAKGLLPEGSTAGMFPDDAAPQAGAASVH